MKDFNKDKAKWHLPLLITDAPEIATLLTTSEVYKTHYSLFQLGWPKDALYNSKGKANYDMTEVDTLLKPKSFAAIKKNLLPDFALVRKNAMADKALNDKFVAFMRTVSLTALAGNKAVSLSEQRSFASLRYTASGTRTAVLAPKKQMVDALTPAGAQPINHIKIQDELLNANQDTVQLLHQKGVPLYKVDVPAFSFLYIPAGFAQVSKTQEADVFGTVMSVVPGVANIAEDDLVGLSTVKEYKSNVAMTFTWLLSTMVDPECAQAKVWHHMSKVFDTDEKNEDLD